MAGCGKSELQVLQWRGGRGLLGEERQRASDGIAAGLPAGGTALLSGEEDSAGVQQEC